jgi:hypothetical protein
MHVTGLALIALLALCLGCATSPGPAPTAEEEPEPAEKEVLALQAFFDEETLAVIRPAWEIACTSPGMRCAGRHGAVPHMTFGSWKVTPEELRRALDQAAGLKGRIPARAFAVELERVGGPAGRSIYYVPAGDAGLADYHRRVIETFNFPFETFREIDIPGQWKPHITLFWAPPEAKEPMDRAEALAGKLTRARIASFGLVLFKGGIRTALEIPCAPPAAE